MTFQPYSVARYGVWLAVAAAVTSVWLGYRVGASLDFALVRSVLVFIVIATLGFAAEAVLTIGVHPAAEAPRERHEAGQDE